MEHIVWKNDKLYLLDQRKLPFVKEFVECFDLSSVANAIKDMVVRGAPAIGVTAAYGVVLGLMEGMKFEDIYKILINTRPTAVNLMWGMLKMKEMIDIGITPIDAAIKIHEDDISVNKRIGEFGSSLIEDNFNILTHCNAGALATGGFGTALGVIYAAKNSGKRIHVFVDETRPYLQGSRLTAFELMENGIECTLICDNMAGYLMKQGRVDAVIVGADRIALNGDTANKIGTYSLSVLASKNNIPFYVAAPLSTFDGSIENGSCIVIEERNPQEVREVFGVKISPDNVSVYNPSFDVTDSELITAFITEEGIIGKPFDLNIKKLLCL
ncbi:MAG: S-methyl-5-thioribose-1-phosphate isomerase [Calditerrivibrio sp.]|nr:S-methyl-5-thioribose-1-phosphate isomerase [Calditerrivibrio sp.]